MSRFFVPTVMACVLSTLNLYATAQDEIAPATDPFVISTGQENGGYWNAGVRMQQVAEGLGLTMDHVTSSGSLANLERLLSERSPVNIAFAQADALQYYLEEKSPGSVGILEKVATIGEECVFIIARSDGDISDDQDMQDAKRSYIGIKSPKSGIWVTFNYMSKLVPELQDMTLIYGDPVEMIDAISFPTAGIEKTVMVVHGTDAHSPEIDMVAANPDKYSFVELKDKRFTQAMPDGDPIYYEKRVRSSVAEDADSVDTICVQGLLMANPRKLSTEQLDALTTLVENHWEVIRPQNES